ncbi:ribosomal prt S23 [Enterospora canceri]|uniref:Ribosomal prt S23 n=1 Tax=Enterospora canceri TaxID=1081671 RepID=A0A1Y1S703_9MICR|nr:ribosomal prt S23 [Enterospora canceri]
MWFIGEIFLKFFSPKMRGLFAAFALRKIAQEKRTHDKTYRRRQRGKIYKSVIGNRPQANAIVLDKLGVEAKQPNSAVRKVCRVQCIGTGRTVFAFAPGDGALKMFDANDEVTIQSLGRSGKSVGDRPGIKYQIIKVAGVSLNAILRGKREKPTR